MKALYVWPSVHGRFDHLSKTVLARYASVFDSLFLSCPIDTVLQINGMTTYLRPALAAVRRAGMKSYCWLTGAYDVPAAALGNAAWAVVRQDSTVATAACLGNPGARIALTNRILTLAGEPITGLLLEEPAVTECWCEHCRSNYSRHDSSERGYYREAVAKQTMWLLKDRWAGLTNLPIGATIQGGADASFSKDAWGCPFSYWARANMLQFICPEIYFRTSAEFSANLQSLLRHRSSDTAQQYWIWPTACQVVPTITLSFAATPTRQCTDPNQPAIVKAQWDIALAQTGHAAIWCDAYLTDDVIAALL
jgi:hypothetical protein